MIIEEVNIAKFRGFQDQHFRLGEQLTIIAGQNGTQKTTLLGMLSQTFSLRSHPNENFRKERPLCGGNFISSFSEKFKFSEVYDKPGEHEWSLKMKGDREPFVIASMLRDKKSNDLRFWKKGDRESGSGYLQYPVIFLSLKRLYPLGEDNKIGASDRVQLSNEEKELYQKLHNKILISRDRISKTDYLESPYKNTLGANTDYYDWKTNSAGQDNVSKIILALISFQRLKIKYPNIYKGGLLVIDELDATMYPGSQYRLLDILKTHAARLSIQVIFTTHSLSLLKYAFESKAALADKEQTCNQIRILYLKKQDHQVTISDTPTLEDIRDNLNVVIGQKTLPKINIYTEDEETWKVFKAFRKQKGRLTYMKIPFSCSSLIGLVYNKVPAFSSPNAIIILDGDVRNDKEKIKQLRGKKNVLLLPTKDSPERCIAKMLDGLSDADTLWKSINPSYTKQFAFQFIDIDEIEGDRSLAKKWFKSQIEALGEPWVTKVINRWIQGHKSEYSEFLSQYQEAYNHVAVQLNIDTI